MLHGGDEYAMKLNYITLAVGIVVLAVIGLRMAGAPLTPIRIVGLAIAVPSAVLFVVARMQLGSAFSIEAKASKLVTAGLYSRIRNPIYVFGALLLAGLALIAGRPILLLLLLVLIPLQAVRVRREEQVLAEKFGDEYAEYKRKTWF
jgi:protein-S-isoprenylcysteine O-methyltransferase Ste14